jgi:superfamily II DNA or RNA helicase
VYSIDTYVGGVGYGSDLETYIRTNTFYMSPDYEKDERYIYGTWDGRVNLFTPIAPDESWAQFAGQFHKLPTGLLQRLTGLLAHAQVPFQVFNGIPTHTPHPDMLGLGTDELETRDYQDTAVFSLLAPQPLAWGFGHPRLGGVLQAGTGAGKTAMAAKYTQMMATPTVFLVNQKDLLRQTAEEFEKFLGCKVGRVGDNKCDIRHITVATVQTVYGAVNMHLDPIALVQGVEAVPNYERKRKILQMMKDARVVFVDECHGLGALQAYGAVSSATNAVSVVGLSASPWRDDGSDILIEAACAPPAFKITASELIERGWLVRPDIHIHHLPAPTDGNLDRNAQDYNKLYDAWITNDMRRNKYIADLAVQHMAWGEVVLILIKRIPHGDMLEKMIPGSVFVHGTLSNKARKDIVDKTRSGEIRCLIATSIADQGLDIPALNVLILARAGKSSTKALQRIGRILRRMKDGSKTRAVVHDLIDNASIFKSQYYKRLAIYKSEPAFRIHEIKGVVYG